MRLCTQIMLLAADAYSHRQPLSGFQAVTRSAVMGTEPSQVVGQVTGGYATEFGDPRLEARMVGVDVLNMPRAVDTNAGRKVDRAMLHAQSAGRTSKCWTAIAAKYPVRWNEWFECGRQRRGVARLGHAIRSHAGAVAGDQDRHLFMREAPLGSLSTAFARFAWQGALALEGEQEVGLIHLRDAGQGFRLAEPEPAFMQAVQRGTGQCVERVPTHLAAITMHAVGVPVSDGLLGSAVGATATGGEAALDKGCRNRLRVETQKAHEGEPIRYLELETFIGEVVQALQDEQFEHDYPAQGFTARCAFAFLGINTLKYGTKHLPVDHGVEPLQSSERLA